MPPPQKFYTGLNRGRRWAVVVQASAGFTMISFGVTISENERNLIIWQTMHTRFHLDQGRSGCSILSHTSIVAGNKVLSVVSIFISP
ncbi:hypothetical protein H5T87_11160 [bacterium]|nr:hypothetical protein [bacterium]